MTGLLLLPWLVGSATRMALGLFAAGSWSRQLRQRARRECMAGYCPALADRARALQRLPLPKEKIFGRVSALFLFSISPAFQ